MTFATGGQEERAPLYQCKTNTWGLREEARLLAGVWHSSDEDA